MDSFLDKIQAIFLDKVTSHMISWHDLAMYDLFEKATLDNGIELTKVFDNNEAMIFTTVIPKGKSFGKHSHDCYERVYVVSGWLEDYATKESKIRGQVMSYAPNITHEPYAKEDTVITVSFTKNKEY